MKSSRASAKPSSRTLARPGSSPGASNKGAIERLMDSAHRSELVAIIGTGVSIGMTNGKVPSLSWIGLIRDGFAHGLQKGTITAAQAEAWNTHLDSSDLDDLLGAAEFMGRKLGAPHSDIYARWLENTFKLIQPANKKMESAIGALNAAGIPLCTLNYDPLLERVTGLPTINVTETGKVTAWMRRETQGILHLHGSWDAPATCILGIRDYETTLVNDVRDLIQRSLNSFKRLLFIGCGGTFSDPNFSALIKWSRDRMKTAAPQHYALVSEGEVAARHADPGWHGFVEPISYGANYSELPAFLIRHFSATPVAKTKKLTTVVSAGPSGHAKLLQDYRTFLLKDCGQMTIEGVRADMDTAQRRFDLERLFVPLKVLPCPPEVPETDPQRAQKLLRWHEKNKKPRPFGGVFAKHNRLALLALPGGGKTLLLKRLAVAYADPARRRASEDALPDLDLTPVLIRCREWREHIHRPILTLLQSLPDITGHAPLAGLSDALLPLFKKGRILLLVDGLDEIHDDGLRSTFVEHLESFLEEHKLTRLVVTSREAGFNLVAPCLARFCERQRVAPLEENAITALCDHWHRLMGADSPEGRAEGREVSAHLLRNDSLRRLAENPLLLTMLLVVKHGAGRLPPDRVSLYSRAVEVLLDTWNIKGHESLSLKEAVPQLACVAFQLMRAGKQTATERELLDLLEEAREKVPQIRRYAKDTPHAFLKRVELRSSLLVEAGHQAEGSGTVPFYQFRHLTFQEYLAAVAAVEGHYMDYAKSDTVLTPLASHLTADEWKEVIPMAAVLARKQAEPLMAALVVRANGLRQKLESGKPSATKMALLRRPDRLPAPIARLVQCLLEEAEAAPETLTAALQLVALFAAGCSSAEDWTALSRGPYGDELLHQAWLLCAPMQWVKEAWLLYTCAALAGRRKPAPYWDTNEGQAELRRLISSESVEEIARAVLTYAELFSMGMDSDEDLGVRIVTPQIAAVERLLFHESLALSTAAMWVWALIRRHQETPPIPLPATLDRIVELWLNDTNGIVLDIVFFALAANVSLPRGAWKPLLTESQVLQIQQIVKGPELGFRVPGCLVVAFHAGDIWSDEELATRLHALSRSSPGPWRGRVEMINAMLRQLGEPGRKHLKRKRPRQQGQD